jgi:putative ABC transport system ATP-binding protein
MIQTQNIVKTYYSAEVATTALSNININIKNGEYVGVTGPSGSGKTSLLCLLGLVEPPTSGEILFMDINTSQKKEQQRAKLRRGNIGFIFQEPNLLDELTIYENIELPLIYLRYRRKEKIKLVEDMLIKLNLIHLRNRYPGQLDGEQQQKTAIARAIITNPALLIADEPTGALNSKSGDSILKILSKLNEEGMTIVLATHSAQVADRTQRVIQIFDGHVINQTIVTHSL